MHVFLNAGRHLVNTIITRPITKRCMQRGTRSLEFKLMNGMADKIGALMDNTVGDTILGGTYHWGLIRRNLAKNHPSSDIKAMHSAWDQRYSEQVYNQFTTVIAKIGQRGREIIWSLLCSARDGKLSDQYPEDTKRGILGLLSSYIDRERPLPFRERLAARRLLHQLLSTERTEDFMTDAIEEMEEFWADYPWGLQRKIAAYIAKATKQYLNDVRTYVNDTIAKAASIKRRWLQHQEISSQEISETLQDLVVLQKKAGRDKDYDPSGVKLCPQVAKLIGELAIISSRDDAMIIEALVDALSPELRNEKEIPVNGLLERWSIAAEALGHLTLVEIKASLKPEITARYPDAQELVARFNTGAPMSRPEMRELYYLAVRIGGEGSVPAGAGLEKYWNCASSPAEYQDLIGRYLYIG